MKRKGLKILCGVLATLCVVGATSTVVGALSDGFKNWDTSTWFDKGTTEPVQNGDLVTTPDDTQPVKMSVRYLSDDTSIKKSHDLKPMTGIVITASLDSQYGECNKFVFSFSEDYGSLYDISITDNTCTFSLKKKNNVPLYVYANTTGNVRYKGQLRVDFLKSLNETLKWGSYAPHAFLHFSSNSIMLNLRNNYNDEDYISINYQDSTGTLKHSVKSASIKANSNWKLSFEPTELFSFTEFNDQYKLTILSSEVLEKFVSETVFKDSEDYVDCGYLDFEIVTDCDKRITSSLSFKVKNFVYTDGGVDMGGDIIVG